MTWKLVLPTPKGLTSSIASIEATCNRIILHTIDFHIIVVNCNFREFCKLVHMHGYTVDYITNQIITLEAPLDPSGEFADFDIIFGSDNILWYILSEEDTLYQQQQQEPIKLSWFSKLVNAVTGWVVEINKTLSL
jgi:hypothetical protein